MVTTSSPQDGATSSSPTNPPPQTEQQPTVAENSNQVNQSPSDDAEDETASPLVHPAPLPEKPPVTNSNANWKRPPPKLLTKLYEKPEGAQVSWHTLLTPDHEEIAKYELYSYKEGTQPPSTSLWQKLGDIVPSALPMACTLSQFLGGYTYHFALRAVDVHGRCGTFSEPLSLYMERDKMPNDIHIKEEPASPAAEEEVAVNNDQNCEEMGSMKVKQEVIEESPTEESPAEESHAEESHAEESHAEESHAEESHAEESHAEESHAEESHAEENHTKENNAEEKAVEHPIDSVTSVKEEEKMVECVTKSENDVGQSVEQ